MVKFSIYLDRRVFVMNGTVSSINMGYEDRSGSLPFSFALSALFSFPSHGLAFYHSLDKLSRLQFDDIFILPENVLWHCIKIVSSKYQSLFSVKNKKIIF